MAGSKKFLEELSRRLNDEGKIVEAGWIGYRAVVIPPAAPPVQLEECRIAFYAGAQHLFSSIMTVLDPGAEPTDKDLDRMTKIDAELRKWLEDFKKKHGLVPSVH